MMLGWLVLTMLFVVALTMAIIIGGAIHVAQQRRRLGCGATRKRERISWPEAEYDGEPLFPPRDYEQFR